LEMKGVEKMSEDKKEKWIRLAVVLGTPSILPALIEMNFDREEIEEALEKVKETNIKALDAVADEIEKERL